jgi:transcriptional regulator with XRE-family HTH domain
MKTVRGSIGERLRHERERRGLELDDVARATRIDRSFLEALENDASPDAFPEPMYARAFLREYARYLGLKSRPLVQAYRTVHPMDERPPIGLPPIRLERRSSKWGRRALIVASLGALAAIAVFSARAALPPERATGDVPTIPAPASAMPTGPGPPEGDGKPPFRGVELRVKVVDGPCWIEVVRGETEVVSGTEYPGFERTFRSKSELHLVLGAPNVVRVTVNGEELVPPSDGGVYGATLTWEKGKVRVTPTL